MPLALTQRVLYLLSLSFLSPEIASQVSSQLVPPSAPCLTLPLHADNLGYSARDLQFYVGSEPRERRGFSGRIYTA